MEEKVRPLSTTYAFYFLPTASWPDPYTNPGGNTFAESCENLNTSIIANFKETYRLWETRYGNIARQSNPWRFASAPQLRFSPTTILFSQRTLLYSRGFQPWLKEPCFVMRWSGCGVYIRAGWWEWDDTLRYWDNSPIPINGRRTNSALE